MPVEKESKIAVWIAAFREWAPTVRMRLAEWWALVREEPVLIWQTTAVRYTAYGIGGLMIILLVKWSAAALMPPLPEGAGEPAQTVHFHVICADPDCGHEFVIVRKFKFNKFPVKCPKCNNKIGYRAVRSTVGPDKGKWVIQR